MKLAEMTWKEVDALDRNIIVVIPTGSLEQHGPHLPLFTDTILATATSEAAEEKLREKVLLTPSVWLGASGHHLNFSGTLSASFESYIQAIEDIVESLARHGFHRFFIINGHGGNTDLNSIAMRKLKERHRNLTLGHSGYFTYAAEVVPQVMEGPLKNIVHSCEAEVSLMMHVRPDLVRKDKLRNDGLDPEPPVTGMVQMFDEITEEGSFGYATYAKPETGKKIFEAAVEGIVEQLERLHAGYVLKGS